MSELLSSITGKQNDFATRFMDGGVIASGALAGTILTLTPPSGQRVRLTHLSTSAATTVDSISILFDAVLIVDDESLEGDNPTVDRFSVGSYQPYAAGLPPFSNFIYFTGNTDEVLTIVKALGSTLQNIYYGYEFGE